MNCPSEFALDDVAIHGPNLANSGAPFAFGGTTAGETPAATIHLASCKRCQDRLADRAAETVAFAALAPELWRAVVTTRTTRRARRRWALPILGVPVAALAGACVVLLALRNPAPSPLSPSPLSTSPSQSLPVPSSPYVGVKGAPAAFPLVIAARRGGRVFTVDDQHTVRAGDELRFIPVGPPTATRRYISIASIDGQGTFSLFYPSDANGVSVPLPSAGQALPGGIVLDDAPGPERLLVVLTATPVPAKTIRAATGGQRDALRDWDGAQIFWMALKKDRPGVHSPPADK